MGIASAVLRGIRGTASSAVSRLWPRPAVAAERIGQIDSQAFSYGGILQELGTDVSFCVNVFFYKLKMMFGIKDYFFKCSMYEK